MKKLISILFIVVALGVVILIFRGDLKTNKVSLTGRYLKSTSDTHIIIDESTSPIVMENRSSKENIFEALQTGDKIEIICNAEIRETYPASTEVYSCKLIERGTIDNINNDVLSNLVEMGWNFDLSEVDD